MNEILSVVVFAASVCALVLCIKTEKKVHRFIAQIQEGCGKHV